MALFNTIKILVTEYNLSLWISLLRQYPKTKILSSKILEARYRSYQGQVSLTSYQEIIEIEGAMASYIALKYPNMLVRTNN